MNLKEMREKRGELQAEIRRLAELANDEKHEWSAEDEEAWTKVNAEFDELGAKLDRMNRADDVDKLLKQPDAHGITHEEARSAQHLEEQSRRMQAENSDVITPEDRALAFQAWARAQYGLDLTEAHEAAARKCGVKPTFREIGIDLPGNYDEVRRQLRRDRIGGVERRDTYYQSTNTGYGGETIPEGFVYNFERALLEFGGMLEVAEVIRTDSGNNMPWPTTNDTSNKGELMGETADSGDSAVTDQGITTSSKTLGAYKFSSKLVRVTAELLEDSAFNMAEVIGSMLGERLGRIMNDYWTTGTGDSQPEGIVDGAASGVTAASATSIDADELLELLHSVNPAYRKAEGVGWMMHDNVVLLLRKLKDSDGRYLWQDSLQVAEPARLLGFPATINQSMSSTITASDIVIVFGALRKYKIRLVRQMRLRRLVERYAEYDQEGFVGFMRGDGLLLDAGTYPVKYLAMEAS
jgi:HK97 family phage major capsid protein